MSHSLSFEGHFDGKTLVPHGPVNLPINEPLIINVLTDTDSLQQTKHPSSEKSTDQRKAALRNLVKMMAGNPEIQDEATRRIHMYDDDRY